MADKSLTKSAIEQIAIELTKIRDTISEHGEQKRNIIDSYYRELSKQLEKLDDKEKYTESFARKEGKRLKEKACEECRKQVQELHVQTYSDVSLSTQNINNYVYGMLLDINVSQRLMFDTLRLMKEFSVKPTETEVREMLIKSMGNRLACRAIENLCAAHKMKVEYFDATLVVDYLESKVLHFLETPFNGAHVGAEYGGVPTFAVDMNPHTMINYVQVSNGFGALVGYNLNEEKILKKLSELIDYTNKTEIKVYDAEPETVSEVLAQAAKPDKPAVDNLIDKTDVLNATYANTKKTTTEDYIEATNGGLS